LKQTRIFGKRTQNKGNESKNSQMGLYTIENFYTTKERLNGVQRQPTKWQKILAMHTSDGGW
jgi:hypothetical protein